ncbi:MAG: dihydroorotase [Paracoccaceae bacterium]|nr:dihydroorotase [Paracoccaceae bacterium]
MDKADAGGQAETAHITILRPDDWHLHLRDGGLLSGVLPESIRHFARALVMPNLQPPVVTARDALNYRKRIESALPPESGFSPLMTLYLTESTDPEDVAAAHGDGVITAVKLYPAGATTHSESGVREVHRVMPVLERMAGIGCPLCVHGEVPDSDVDVFDRESVFIENVLDPLRREIPDLRIVLEHVTTAEGVDYVGGGGDSLAATITVHHLLINRNHILAGGIRPHYYCLPVAKRERHRLALREAAVSGHPRFFLGTDSAPHCVADKETAKGCAGVFTATNAVPCVAQVFEDEGSLGTLEAFLSLNGAAFYGLPTNHSTITLTRQHEPASFPACIGTTAGPVVVFDPGIDIYWTVA